MRILQVKDWGSGEPADLGSLQVESFSPDLFSDHSKPFYEQLARRLEELQVAYRFRVVVVSIVRSSGSMCLFALEALHDVTCNTKCVHLCCSSMLSAAASSLMQVCMSNLLMLVHIL